ncbi:MAG: lysine--tRNA ligase, partial [Rhodospirillaceae bacterium]|nr:lysine--tRNA ligase [Rhodospirillaceae bacterium]
YRPGATPENAPILDKLVEYAINYYRDFVRPAKQYRKPGEVEKAALEDLAKTLQILPAGSEGADIQTEVYEVGKRHNFENLKDWFKALYEILLGQSQGPRMGSFIALYGIDETVALIGRAIAGEDLSS